jgi:hypothetical protein
VWISRIGFFGARLHDVENRDVRLWQRMRYKQPEQFLHRFRASCEGRLKPLKTLCVFFDWAGAKKGSMAVFCFTTISFETGLLMKKSRRSKIMAREHASGLGEPPVQRGEKIPLRHFNQSDAKSSMSQKKKSKKRDALGAQRARIINFCSAFNNVFGAVSAAFAPIRDPSGKLIAMLGVSLSPAPYSTLNEIGSAMAAPFAVTVLLALMLAALLGRSVTRPLDSPRAQIELIGKGH